MRSHRHVEQDPSVSEERVRAAAVEYGLITSGISVAIIPSVTGVGNKLVTIFNTVQTAL
jgi:Flp pilus assembly pilin Flp